MDKIKNRWTRRVTAKKAVDDKAVVAEEKAFHNELATVNMVQLENPYDLVISEFASEKISPENYKKNNSIRLLAIIEIINLIEDDETPEIYIKNIVQILKGENLKAYEAQLMKKGTQVKRLSEQLKFHQPQSILVLQKTGQFMKSVLLRDCFVTQDAFGQIKDKNKNVLIKPNLFKEHSLMIEKKPDAATKQKSDKAASKADKSPAKADAKEKKPFVWPDKKEIKDHLVRIYFENLKDKRERAIYFIKNDEAINLKDNAIVRRVIEKDAWIKTKLHTVKTIWKVKQAEAFYKRTMQRFFKDPEINQKLINFNSKFKQKIKYFFKKTQPNIYNSDYKPNNVYDFQDNSHLIIKRPNAAAEKILLNDEKQFFATIVSPEAFLMPMPSEFLADKKRMFLKSPFENAGSFRIYNFVKLENVLNNFSTSYKERAIASDHLKPAIDQVLANSKMILKFKRLLIQNLSILDMNSKSDKAFNELCFEASLFVDQGSETSTTVSRLSMNEHSYLSLDFNNSIKVEKKSFPYLKLKIVEQSSKSVVFDHEINILENLETFYLENDIVINSNIKFGNADFSTLLIFTLVLVPRNLETAHITVRKDLLDANFDNFFNILKTSQTYANFKKSIYEHQYQATLREKFYRQPFILSRLMITKPSDLVCTKVENYYYNSLKNTDHVDLANNLKQLGEKVVSFNDFLIAVASKAGEKEGEHSSFFSDLFERSISVFSSAERLFLERFIFANSYANYVNVSLNSFEAGFQKQIVSSIEQTVESYAEQNIYFHSSEIFLLKSLAIQIYLVFENNTVDGEAAKLNFSPRLIPLIANTMILNSSLEFNDLFQVCLSRSLRNVYIKTYTDFNHITYLDNLVIYFKLIFHGLYTEQSILYTNYLISFDQILMEFFVNSFASFLDPVAFNVYQDFKSYLETVFILQKEHFKLLEKLQDIEITFSSFVDILFVVAVLVSNFIVFKNRTAPENFLEIIKGFFVKENYSIRKTLIKVMELLDYIVDVELFEKEFRVLKLNIKKRRDIQIACFKNFSQNVRQQNLDLAQIKEIIKKEVTNNADLQIKSQSLFHNTVKEDNKEKIEASRMSKVQASRMLSGLYVPNSNPDRQMIQQDIFFDVLDDLNMHDYDNIEPDQKPLLKHIHVLAFLNNLDINFINSFMHTKNLSSNFNNINELDVAQLSNFAKTYLHFSELQQLELYNDLSNLSDSPKIPLLRLLILLICSSSDKQSEVLSGLTFLAEQLTSFFYPNATNLFNEVVKFVVDEVYNFLPVTYLPEFTHNLIDRKEPLLQCWVKSGKISLETDIIDVTDICIKHFTSNLFVSGKPSIQFNVHFCQDLTVVFQDLAQLGSLSEELYKFELSLEVLNAGKTETFNVPFRICLDPEIQVLCQQSEILYFSQAISEKNLMPAESLAAVFNHSPLCLYWLQNDAKLAFNLADKPFLLRYKSKESLFDLHLTFMSAPSKGLNLDLLPWQYKDASTKEDAKFNAREISVSLPFVCFLMNIKSILAILSVKIAESLDGEDFLRFIKKQTARYEILNSKNKTVDPLANLFELSEIEKTIKSEGVFTLTIDFGG